MGNPKREYLGNRDELTMRLVRDGDRCESASKTKVRIARRIGEGSTCVTYEGFYRPKGFDYLVPVIIKELYPDMPGITRNSDHSLNFNNVVAADEFARRKQQFEDNIKAYRMVDIIPELKSTIPDLIGVGLGENNNLYHIFKAYKGKTLADVCREKLSIYEQLNIIKRLAELLKLWCGKEFMLLDLSPSNILYLEDSKDLQFIDFDSLLIKRENRWEKAVDGYRVNALYLPTALYQEIYGGGSAVNRPHIERHLNENTCHFYLGMQLYAMLCSNMPQIRDITKNDIDKQISNLARKYPSLAQGKDWTEIQNRIETLLLKLLDPTRGRGYSSLDEVISDLDQILGLLRSSMDPQVIEQRYEILAGNLIEEFPAYKYFSSVSSVPQSEYRWNNIGCENVEKTIEVLIAGNHQMRKALIKYLISCLQMDHVRICLHLFSSDVMTFWNELTSAWPLIERVCRVAVSGMSGPVYLSEKMDETLVDRQLAEIYLYPENDKQIITKKCIDKNIRYIILLDDHELNLGTLQTISSRGVGTERFVAFLCRNRMPARETYNEYIHLFPISEESASDALDRELLSMRIFKRGFYVHSSYELGNNPYASRKKLREEYESKPYYQSASIRSALHAAYKLVSAGIDPESNDAAWEYYRKVLGHRELLQEQMALEHRSWTAFMIMNGAVRPKDIKAINEYAFKGGMDWKNNSDENHMIHPCVAASSAGSYLSETIWDEFDQKESIEEAKAFLWALDCDELDRTSLSLHYILKDRRKKYKDQVEQRLKAMQEDNLSRNRGFHLVIDELASLWPALHDEEGVYEDIKKWKEAVERAREYIGKKEPYRKELSDLENYALPFTKLSLRHDFKNSDEDIVRAVPQLFLRTDTPFGKPIGVFSVMRFLSGCKWIDLQAALQTEPEKLILLADYQNPDLDPYAYKSEYQDILDHCGISTRVDIQDKTALNRLPGKTHVFFDLTGPGGLFVNPSSLPARKKYVHKILFNGNHFVSVDSDYSVEILEKRPALSVKEWLHLHDCSVIDTGKEQHRNILKTRTTINLWNIMRTLSNVYIGSGTETAWDVLIKMMRRTLRTDELDISAPGTKSPYSTVAGNLELKVTGLRQLLKYLASEKIIECLSFAADDEEVEETVSFETKYESLGEKICEICNDITKYCKVSAILKEGRVCIQHFSRKIIIPEDELTDDERQLLEDKEQRNLLKEILNIAPVSRGERTITVISNLVFETLLSSREFLRAVIYAECSRKRVFDAVMTNTGYTKDGISYDAQIIGIRDNCFYPIVITDCTDHRELRLHAIDMMEGLPGTVIYFIDAKDEISKKEGRRYYCITPNDVDCLHESGTYMLRITDAIRDIMKNKSAKTEI